MRFQNEKGVGAGRDFENRELAGLRKNFKKIERREWWLWLAAGVITLLLTVALASFLLPNASHREDFHALYVFPQAVRGLVGLVFLFDLYTIYQHLQIHRIRRQLLEREELFHLISENAADMIAVVDTNGRRLFNSLSYQRVLGYSPEELQASSAFEQIHPGDRERVKKAADDALGEDIEVSLALNTGLGNVKADQSQIEQVIMNLAVNARDAMPMGGKLKIETANVELDQAYTRNHPGSKVGNYVMLAVTDTGTGMDAGTLTHIFEPFFTTKERGKGTGLGLATVYGVVKQSNGYIWVDSAPGKGTSFQIYLPRHLGQTIMDEPRADSTEHLCGSESILLAEDAEPLRKLAQTFLAAAGFRVLSAQSGEDALEVAARHGGIFDLLLTDVVMPGMNGRVLAEQLLPRQPGMKVLYMSGYTDSFIAGHGVLDPGTHLLHKPFTEEVLIRKVREVLDGGEKPAPTSTAVAGLVGTQTHSCQ